PVVGHALGMADAGVPAQPAVDVLLEAHEAGLQRLLARLSGGRVGHGMAAVAMASGHRGALVVDAGAVHARTGDHAVRPMAPGALGDHAQVVEARIHRPRHRLVGTAAHGAAAPVAAVLHVHAGDQLDVRAAPGGRRAAAAGAALDVGGHRRRHGTGGVGVAQAVVVHHVVGHVVEHAGLEGLQALADVRLLEAQAVVAAVELAAVHAAAGIPRLAVADAHAQLQQGVLVGRPAQREVGVPLLPGRAHALAVAIVVIAGFRTVGADACV